MRRSGKFYIDCILVCATIDVVSSGAPSGAWKSAVDERSEASRSPLESVLEVDHQDTCMIKRLLCRKSPVGRDVETEPVHGNAVFDHTKLLGWAKSKYTVNWIA